jgi:hypothetical protein
MVRWWHLGLICIFSAATMTKGAMCVIIAIAVLKVAGAHTPAQVMGRRTPAAGKGEGDEPFYIFI